MFKPLPNMRPATQIRSLRRSIFLHPLTNITSILFVLFFVFFFAEDRYANQPKITQFVLTFAWGGMSYVGFYIFSGTIMHQFVRRNVPVMFVIMAYFSLFTTAEICCAFLLFDSYHTLNVALWHFFSTIAVFLIHLSILTLFFEQKIRDMYGLEQSKVPIWWPVSRDVDLLQSLLPPHKRGKVLKLQAANQYVEVITENGKYDVRQSLKSLMKLLPENEGIHLHRSVWIAKDQIKGITNIKGNPKVIDMNGQFVPVSRGKIKLVKEALEARARGRC